MRWRTLGLAITLVVGLSIVRAPAVAALVVPAVFAVLLLIVLVRALSTADPHEPNGRLLRWTLLAFALHLMLGLLISGSKTATSYFGGDAVTYHQGATALVQSWVHHVAGPVLPAGKEGFFYELGGLYYLFGAHAAAGLVFNAAAAAALVPLMTDTTRRLFGVKAARYAPTLVVVLPAFLIWTSQLLREASVLFLVAVAVNLALRLSERFRVLEVGALVLTLGLLFSFRANVAYVLATTLVVGLVVSRRRVVSGVSMGAAILSLSLLLVTTVGIGYSGYRLAAQANLQQVNAARLDSSSSASGFAQGTDVSTTSHALGYLPIGLVSFAVGPLPWQVSGARQLPALLDVAVLWILLPSLWRGLRASYRKHERRAYVLVIPAVVLAAMLSLLVGNFGTLVRERMQVVVLLVPFAALGLAMRDDARTRRPLASARDGRLSTVAGR